MMTKFYNSRCFATALNFFAIFSLALFFNLNAQAASDTQCGSITGFQLVNADTGAAICAIPDGAVVNPEDLPANYRIEILTNGSLGSVKTTVNGNTRTENYHRYDYPSSGSAWNAGEGNYSVSSVAYSQKNREGSVCDEESINFTIGAPCTGAVTGFQLINTDNGEVISPINDGDDIDVASLPDNYRIEILTDGQVGSVVTTVNGNTRTENYHRYDYPSSGSNWNAGVGTYSISSTIRNQSGGQGEICDESAIQFSISGCGSLTGYALINSDTDEVITALEDGDAIEASTLPANYHLEILTEGHVGSVSTTVNGTTKTENYFHYDFPTSNSSWNAGPGSYSISSSLFPLAQAQGDACDESAISITIEAAPCEFTADQACVREVYDTQRCGTDTFYQIWLGDGLGYFPATSASVYEENDMDGTAHYSTTIQVGTDNISIDVVLSGATTEAPTGSPKDHFCEIAETEGWVYYPNFCGTFVSEEHGTFYITRKGPAFQLGHGANVTSATGDQFGGSGWFNLSGGDGFYKTGDFNIDLSENCDVEDPCEGAELVDCSVDIVSPCPVGMEEAIVSWDVPTAVNAAGEPLNVVQIEGGASGSAFPEGVHVITYQIEGCTQTCSFTVTVEPCEDDVCGETTVSAFAGSVTVTNRAFDGAATVEIYDLNSNLLFTDARVRFSRGSATVESGLPSGFYIVRIVNNELVCTQQFFNTDGQE